MKILFTGGGTGGHIFPIIAIYREFKRVSAGESVRFFYIGPKDETSAVYLSNEDIRIKYIMAGKMRRYFDFRSILENIIDIIFKIPIGTVQAFFNIFWLSPDVIFSKGGYGSLPVVVAGWMLGTPVFLHESDAIPGAANRFLGRLSIEIFSSFPGKKTKDFPIWKTISIGNPVRSEILQGSVQEAKNIFKLTGEKPVILILGGSQGSQRINDVILQTLPDLIDKFEVIHQCGTNNFKNVDAEAKVVTKEDLKKYYHLYPFLSETELADAYQVANLVVSRAGSGSIFEISSVKKPSILIPLPESAQNHQVENAYSYSYNGACLVIEEANFTHHFFLDRLKYLFSHQNELDAMSDGAAKFAKPRAAEIIASYLWEYLKL
ncbi:MAG: hypothetical protein A3H01_00255 [Candidatus Wildermuthbacteria bacterium RIFCSPLOWO2_12_FULL_40_9]|uniref:UDP-N-acetylglucosamine--N-acetylmuramyl-(pentapeptide) pyrophosphoryl-undecaprenol N-acetylglucosamine transferase n=1 Tax=Candidatus Wildermuthbacteria bacterium RIFCSPLOWO2_12_FULL_40_9 TaxID=1802467 RepID=A0A1G2RUI9_9BACT|nr:MAG: hypothetical protein A3H01_00255 [Candidatus Wildermuthbacteria bacterium RIFCSPLOWO2_12_FULL_40_9]